MIAPIAPLPTAAIGRGNNVSSYAAFAGRILLAAIFVLSGFSKAADPASALGYIGSVGLPFPEVALGGAILIEIVGGVAEQIDDVVVDAIHTVDP